MKLFTQFIIYIDNCCTYNYFFFLLRKREREMGQMENWFLIWSTRIDTLMAVYTHIYNTQ